MRANALAYWLANLAAVLGCTASWRAPATAAAAPDSSTTLQPFGVQDLVRLQRISEVSVSPDGKYAAYTVRSTDMDSNKGRTSVWIQELRRNAAAPRRIGDGSAGASSPEWSGDGRSVYLLMTRNGSTQVWKSALGAEPQQITNLSLDVGSFRVSAKGDRILVSLEVYRDCPDLPCTKARLDAGAHAAAHGLVYETLFARHWDAWSDGRRSQLFAVELDAAGLANGTPRNLTARIDGDVPSKPFGGREDYAFSPDGRHVAFAARLGTAGEPWSTNFDVYQVPVAGGEPDNLTLDNAAWDAQPAYSPDGTRLAYLAMDRPGFEADRFHLVLLDLNTKVKRALTERWDRSISSFAWSSDGNMLFATADHLGQRPLWAIDAATGRTSAITAAGEVESFAVAPNRILYTASTLASPADLFAVTYAGGKTQRLTHLNEAALAKRKLAEYEQFDFPGWNDENVFAYVMKPADYKRGRKYPVALLVHGGPQGSMANLWHWRWNAQSFAGAGYAVIMIDFHGSTGYGQSFTDSISTDWGGKPLEDLQRGVAASLKRYPWMDGEHMCALGGSYGGFMMNWILGQWPDRFKCIVTHDGIFDQRSMYYSTEELWFPEWENGGPEYANPAAYAKFNPVDHVGLWKTPTLVIHGQLDYRVPYAQGLAVYTALQRRGVPSKLLYFPDENHWVLKPANSIQWYDTVIAWMNRWTRP